jgi:hypothetical protein
MLRVLPRADMFLDGPRLGAMAGRVNFAAFWDYLQAGDDLNYRNP